jgi:alpha-amylase/alpha-mannosidase (GH57 family)
MSVSPAHRFVCVHGHFYQPPRENPWLETVETQDSAAPYHDWNERITAECYAPNGAARIVDGKNRILRITNNYARMSFNVGPTLLSWMQEKAPLTCAMIRDADRLSQIQFGGHGSAIAQVYNHIIMPLASTRDRETQIVWGIADFEHRYGRKPEGMWLAETAVDLESLDLLARHGIRFTILAPHQCARVRPLPGAEAPAAIATKAPPAKGAVAENAAAAAGRKETPDAGWKETPDAGVDTTQPYLVQTSPGHSIAVFFYDGPVSRAIAFDGLLNSGEAFAERLMGGFRESEAPQLAHVATDGESYGHHHRHGEMALAYALQLIEEGDAKLANYGQFLANFPPTREAEIVENSSWSCFHGVERWRSDCGCNGGKAGWNQKWRTPLRQSLDWLRDCLAPLVRDATSALLSGADAARNSYISVILDRSQPSVNAFFARNSIRTLTTEERVRALQLMELERNAMLMYTSCGWFFDDISGIETVQIVTYAARVLELAAALFPETRGVLEKGFTDRLAEAKSNEPQWRDGRYIYDEAIRPMLVDLEQVVAHYAISCVFPRAGETSIMERDRLFCYTIEHLWETTLPYGLGQLRLGRVRICSLLTEECEEAAYGLLHFGDQNVSAAVKRMEPGEQEALSLLAREIEDAVDASNLTEVVRLMDDSFGESRFSLTSLFADEQRRIVKSILDPAMQSLETALTDLYSSHASLLHFLGRSGLPRPAALRVAAQFAIHAQLRRALEADPIDVATAERLLAQAREDAVVVDHPTLGYLADERMHAAMERLQQTPSDPEAVRHALILATALKALPFTLDLWQAQNIWYELSPRVVGEGKALRDDFLGLGAALNIRVDRHMKSAP